MTPDENRADLERHAEDFRNRTGFTYTVLDPASRDVIGCVYIYPVRIPSTTPRAVLGKGEPCGPGHSALARGERVARIRLALRQRPVRTTYVARYSILLGMATKADFTDDEWKAMQEGITGAGLFVALVDRGFFDSFKEANALAHHLRDAHYASDSVLVRDLATGHDRPFGATASPQEVEQKTVATLQQAVAALEAKSPEDLPAYRQLVTEVAQSVAEAAKGVSQQENQALDSIRAALGS